MSWFSTLFGGGAQGASKLVDSIGVAFDNVVTSDEERLVLANAMAKIKQEPARLQVMLNALDAKGNWFNSGWRPSIGWVCSVSLAMYFVPQYAIAAAVWVKACAVSKWTELPPYPVSSDAVMELTLAMLGMAVIRSAEKMSGVARK